jgi:hypothetical protein
MPAVSPNAIVADRVDEHVIAETGWLDDADEATLADAHRRMTVIYEEHLKDFVAELGPPDIDKSSNRAVAEELHFEAGLLSGWRKGSGWLYLACIQHDRDTPVIVACGYREPPA